MAGEACIFCRIVAGEAPASIVFQDERVVAFMDLCPVAEGHLLIVPRRHYATLFEADDDSLQRVVAISRRIARAQRQALAPDGVGVHQLNGAAAGQTVFHYHMHLIPRRLGDPIAFHGRREAPREQLAAVAARIAAALDGGEDADARR